MIVTAIAVLSLSVSTARAEVITNDPIGYVKLAEYNVEPMSFNFPGLFIDLLDLILVTNDNLLQIDVGPDEHSSVDAALIGQYATGTGAGAVQLTGPMEIIARNKAGNTTGTFQTEIVSMSLSGNVGPTLVELRESPLEASAGQATITDLGGGLYHIDSFFDVFTELSVDGGNSWVVDRNAPVRAEIFPEPGALALMGLGAMALLRRR
jgi:hypothetical protein